LELIGRNSLNQPHPGLVPAGIVELSAYDPGSADICPSRNSICTTEYPFADFGEQFGTVVGTVGCPSANCCVDHI
jgi:hypothetical protein